LRIYIAFINPIVLFIQSKNYNNWSRLPPATKLSFILLIEPFDKMPNPAHQRNNPEITALPATAPIEEIVSVIRRDGGIIIKGFITPDETDRIQAEADPHYQKVGKYEGTLFPPTDPPLR